VNKNRNEFQEPIDPMQMALYKMIMRKQLHILEINVNTKPLEINASIGFLSMHI
jgi:hypothetical protein